MTQSNNSGLRYLIWNLVDHYQNDHPDADQTKECRFAIETIEEIEANYISRSEVLGLLPEKRPLEDFATDEYRWRQVGANDTIDLMAKNIRGEK